MQDRTPQVAEAGDPGAGRAWTTARKRRQEKDLLELREVLTATVPRPRVSDCPATYKSSHGDISIIGRVGPYTGNYPSLLLRTLKAAKGQALTGQALLASLGLLDSRDEAFSEFMEGIRYLADLKLVTGPSAEDETDLKQVWRIA